MKVKLPRHLRAKRLADGQTSYYFEPPTRYRKAGCPIVSEALGDNLSNAVARAEELNQAYDAWRRGEDHPGPRYGTVAWLRREYETSDDFTNLSQASQRRYTQLLDIIENGYGRAPSLGDYPINSFGRRHARAWYGLLREPPKEGDRPRLDQANKAVAIARILWTFAQNEELTTDNVWKGWRLQGVKTNVVNWTVEQYRVFVRAADKLGFTALGTAATLAFELCQREGDVLRLPWTSLDDGEITVRQRKTGVVVVQPISPELVQRLENTPRLGPLIVMVERRGVWRPYNHGTFRHHVQSVRVAAGLPSDLQFYRLRHLGLTEAGDAGATDAEIVALSGHMSREIVGVYTQRTRQQASSALEKRLSLRTKLAQESE